MRVLYVYVSTSLCVCVCVYVGVYVCMYVCCVAPPQRDTGVSPTYLHAACRETNERMTTVEIGRMLSPSLRG